MEKSNGSTKTNKTNKTKQGTSGKQMSSGVKLGLIGVIILSLFGVIILLTSMTNATKMEDNPYDKEDLKQSTIDLIGNKSYSNIITPTDLEKKISETDTVFAYFFSPECVYCKQYTPVMMPIATEQGVQVDQLNLLEYDDEFTSYSIEATPTLVVFKNGKEVDRIVGSVDEKQTKEFFKVYK